jgi:hypothetical protein
MRPPARTSLYSQKVRPWRMILMAPSKSPHSSSILEYSSQACEAWGCRRQTLR